MATQEELPKTGDEANSETSGEGVGKPPSNVKLFLMLALLKLKVVAGYVMDGFAPVVASLALILAVYTYQTSHGKSDKSAAKMASMEKALIVSKTEIGKLRETMLKDKVTLEAERKRMEEREFKLIQHISQLEIKMKTSPTLEEQFQPNYKPQVSMPASAVIAVKPAPVAASAVVAPSKVTPAKVAAPVVVKKPIDQTQILKEAIEKLNKK